MRERQINQDEDEDLLYNRGHYYGPSSICADRFDVVVFENEIGDWRDVMRGHVAEENKRALESVQNFFDLDFL